MGRRRARSAWRGSVLIDSSTVSPALARRVAAACRERGVEFLDAPVTGGTWGAEKGELVFMVGGEAATLARVEPVLGAMGKKWFHLGPHGAGQTVKLAMNFFSRWKCRRLAEALALVAGAGIPAENLLGVMQASMARAAVLDVKAPDDPETGLHAKLSPAPDAQRSGPGARFGESGRSAAAGVRRVARKV